MYEKKIKNTFRENAEVLDIVMPMNNLLEYSDNYSMTSGSLCNYHTDDTNYYATENNGDGNKVNTKKTITSKPFEYNTKKFGRASDDNNILDIEVVVPLIYLNNFWIFLYLLLINCEIELDLSWSKECIIFEISITPKVWGDNPVDAIQTTGATFQINNDKLYVPVVTLSVNDNIKFLENIKQELKKKNFLDEIQI